MALIENEIDYGATADGFSEENLQDDGDGDSAEGSASSEGSDVRKRSDEIDDDDDDEDMGGDLDAGLEDGDRDDEDDDQEEEDYVSEKQDDDPDFVEIKQPVSAHGEPCSFDLRNLLAMNSHQINTKELYTINKGGEDNVSISLPKEMQVVKEDYLLKRALDGCGQLLAALWQQPKEKTDSGYMVRLPLFDESRIPRALPPPAPKKETKWERFAKERGIALNKTKRSRKVWDENTGTWMFRHGYQKANDDLKDWPIMEVKDNEDPFEDPWERMRESKRVKVDKNIEQRMRNQERAGDLAKGTTTRFTKSLDRARKLGKTGGNKDRDHVSGGASVPPPSGVPVDLKSTKASGPLGSAKRGKESTLAALVAVQRSTASMGRFDKMREDEPERKKALSGGKKRKFESPTDKSVVQSERDRSLKVLKTVIEGGGVAKERDIRKGRLAKGETAYDYEYNDGLGPSAFKKKKGRAGVGKAKKMTKKRIK